MVDLEQYDIALIKHHDTRDTITTPFVLDFHHSYLDEVKHFVDCTKLSVIARPVGGEQRIGISKTS
jgi:hypothetical protein